MNLTVRILGAEVLHLSTDAAHELGAHGDSTSYPVGFVKEDA